MKLFDGWANFALTTSETKRRLLDINWYTQVASQDGKQLKTKDLRKLGNIMKISKRDGVIA